MLVLTDSPSSTKYWSWAVGFFHPVYWSWNQVLMIIVLFQKTDFIATSAVTKRTSHCIQIDRREWVHSLANDCIGVAICQGSADGSNIREHDHNCTVHSRQYLGHDLGTVTTQFQYRITVWRITHRFTNNGTCCLITT